MRRSVNITFAVLKFTSNSLQRMDDFCDLQLNGLVHRLKDAERKSKILSLEIKNIRKEIASLSETTNFILLNRNSKDDRLIACNSNNKRELSSDESDTNTPKRSRDDFTEENGYVVVFTDGACENNGRQNAKAGYGVWFDDAHPLNVSKPVTGKATNNTAEIQACIAALTVLKEQNKRRVLIKTDSEFTINCMTKWIQGWKKKNWKLASGGPVKNKTDLEKLDNLCRDFDDVKWEHVRGHRGVRGNEEADKLARAGALMYCAALM